MTSPMRALSFWRPWPALILANHPRPKRTENRGWETNYRDWFVLHNGQKWDDDAQRLALDLDMDDIIPWQADDHRPGLVGVARLVSVCSVMFDDLYAECSCDEWAMPGQRHWQLAPKVYAFPEVIPCPGRQGWWHVPPDQAGAVSAQMANIRIGQLAEAKAAGGAS